MKREQRKYIWRQEPTDLGKALKWFWIVDNRRATQKGASKEKLQERVHSTRQIL